MTAYHHSNTDVNKAYKVFFEALKLDDIDALVAAAWNFFNMPVLLTDENYKLISMYPRQKVGEGIWDTLLEKSVLPNATVEAYQREYLENQDIHYKPFYADSGLVAECPRIFGEVFEGDNIYGHVAVFMFDEPLFDGDISSVQVFIDALKLLMIPRKSRERSSLSSYLADLLDTSAAPQIRSLAARSLSASLPGAFALMATPVGDTASERAFATMIISQIPTIYRSAVSAFYSGSVVTLFGLMSGGAYSDEEEAFFARVAAQLSPANFPSGISMPFTDLSELHGRFMQARTTALLSEKQFDFFDRLYPGQMFAIICKSAEPQMFIHPRLFAVKEYDAGHNTEYFDTLKAYCMAMHDRERCAAELCIHRNTLLYRLNRIQELFGISFDDPRMSLMLLDSFQLWDIHEKLQYSREK